MERQMFGHRKKKPTGFSRVPGEPISDRAYDEGRENEESYDYVKNKDVKERGSRMGMNRDNPPGYEGKEHVKYRDPGYSSHHIKYPQDEPHMKSHVTRDEEHEAEDDYHKEVPDQTHYDLVKKIRRAHMKMDEPEEIEEPAKLRGNITHNVPYGGEEDTSGEERMGSNDMQSGMSKDHRKKMIVAITRRKMKKNNPY